VLLSWKASAPPDAKHSAAAGYCVYRGTDPKNLPNQLLNPIAFTQGTSCTDNNSVQNGVTYYYVVRAVSAGGTPSDASKPPVPRAYQPLQVKTLDIRRRYATTVAA